MPFSNDNKICFETISRCLLSSMTSWVCNTQTRNARNERKLNFIFYYECNSPSVFPHLLNLLFPPLETYRPLTSFVLSTARSLHKRNFLKVDIHPVRPTLLDKEK